MKQEDCIRVCNNATASDGLNNGPVAILAVGDPEEWVKAGQTMPGGNDIAFAAFSDITAELLDSLRPDVVLSPLLATGFDCIDLAEVLVGHGFKGRYRAVSKRLPRPALVVREIKQLCPRLDFDILEDD